MKQRNFFPRQVLRRLVGRDPASLRPGELSALGYFMRVGRRLGHRILICPPLATVRSPAPAWHEALQCGTWRTGKRRIAVDFEQLAAFSDAQPSNNRGTP